MQKMVLSMDLQDNNKCKKKVLKMASSVPGIDSMSLDMKEKKLTLVGTMDLMQVVEKLRKTFHTVIVTVGPAKEEKPKAKPKPDPKDKVPEIPYYYAPFPYQFLPTQIPPIFKFYPA
ncbi:unnamed protein product [Amaranthus hypochondriacus]